MQTLTMNKPIIDPSTLNEEQREIDYKTAFLRDLQECLIKHHANINAYHIEDDKLVVDLNWLGGTLTIGPSDDIRIDDKTAARFFSND